MPLPEWIREAVDIAKRYSWDIPDAVQQLRNGVVVDGFPTEVGQTIALMLRRPIISIDRYRYRDRELANHYRQHARVLVRLRVLLSSIRAELRSRAQQALAPGKELT